MTKVSQADRTEALAQLRATIKPGDRIYTILRHRAASGMMRVIDLYVMSGNEPCRITWQACKAAGFTYHDKHQGMKLEGCGMDMGFHAVYNLGAALWPDGTPEPHSTRNGEPDRAGGYALKHEWL